MNPETYPFNAVIRAAPDKGGAYVIFPHDVRRAEFGAGRAKVRATFHTSPSRSSCRT